MKRSYYIYLAGVLLFGLVYEPVKLALGGRWGFLLAAIVYLLLVRMIADYFDNP